MSHVSRTPRPVLVPPWNVRPLASRAFTDTFTPCQYCVRASPKSGLERPVGLRADRPKAGIDRDRVTAAAWQIRMLRRGERPRRVVGRPDELVVVDEEVLGTSAGCSWRRPTRAGAVPAGPTRRAARRLGRTPQPFRMSGLTIVRLGLALPKFALSPVSARSCHRRSPGCSAPPGSSDRNPR